MNGNLLAGWVSLCPRSASLYVHKLGCMIWRSMERARDGDGGGRVEGARWTNFNEGFLATRERFYY